MPVPTLTRRGIVGFPEVDDLPGLRLEVGVHTPSFTPVPVVWFVPVENYVDHRLTSFPLLIVIATFGQPGRARQSPGPAPTAPRVRGVDRRQSRLRALHTTT